MKHVLFVGQEPESVDFSDPALPPGLNAEKIHAGIAIAMKQMAERRWHAELCLVAPDASAVPAVEARLTAAAYDCVVIGAGLRVPPKSVLLFESLINAIHKTAPHVSIAFNTKPEDTAAAVGRWLEDQLVG